MVNLTSSKLVENATFWVIFKHCAIWIQVQQKSNFWFIFPAGGFCDFQHESRCWSSQARSSGERPTLFSKRLKHMMKWDFGTSELLRWYHLSRTFVIASELWWFFCFASLQQSTYKVVIKLLLQKTRLRNIFLKV